MLEPLQRPRFFYAIQTLQLLILLEHLHLNYIFDKTTDFFEVKSVDDMLSCKRPVCVCVV